MDYCFISKAGNREINEDCIGIAEGKDCIFPRAAIPKGSFIVMKTGTHPMRTRLQLFLNWGITFGEPYVVPERANRAVAYANRVDLERNLPQLSEPEEMDESRGYAVSSRGGIAHAPAQERAVKRGKQMKTFGEEER